MWDVLHAGKSRFIMKMAICIPTYNESENIRLLIAKLVDYFPDAGILIVDDSSPDGTSEIVSKISENNKNINLLVRPVKDGLGKAYCAGFGELLKNKSYDLILQMDADFSHSPDFIEDLLDRSGHADLVIGSRYVKNGDISNWAFWRLFLSRFGAAYARFWLNFQISDPTGGFKLWHRDLLERVMTFPHASSGYAFQVETTYIAWKMNARIAEVPVKFDDRDEGASKMTWQIAIEAAIGVPRMPYIYRDI